MIVTHDIEGGLLICDRVAMLTGGTLRFCGTPEEFRGNEDPVVRSFANQEGAGADLGPTTERRMNQTKETQAPVHPGPSDEELKTAVPRGQ